MRYTVKQFRLCKGDDDYGIISSTSLRFNLDQARGWVDVKGGIKYHVITNPTVNSGGCVIVEVAIPEQHPIFNIDLIIRICSSKPTSQSVGYRSEVMADISDLIADTFYKAGVPYEYEAYAQK